MVFSLQPNTLAFNSLRPGVVCLDNSQSNLKEVVSEVGAFKDIPSKYMNDQKIPVRADPEEDAVSFYMLNHAMAIIKRKVHPLEPLGAYLPIVNLYHGRLATSAIRMFSYLLLICTRESRHIHDGVDSTFMVKLRGKYGNPISDFHKLKLRGTSSSGAVSSILEYPPTASLSAYTNFMSDVFRQGSFSSSFGGKKWADIADVLRDYSCGKLSAEMMLDTAFTLCHNGGPIFNKEILYKDTGSLIYQILDVQRAGMIPQWVNEEKNSQPSWIVDDYLKCRAVLPEFDGYVDWFKVEELGAVLNYSAKQKAMKKNTKAVFESPEAKMVASIKAEQLAGNYVTLFPGGSFKKIEAVR